LTSATKGEEGLAVEGLAVLSTVGGSSSPQRGVCICANSHVAHDSQDDRRPVELLPELPRRASAAAAYTFDAGSGVDWQQPIDVIQCLLF
jgi:hypothetical protein